MLPWLVETCYDQAGLELIDVSSLASMSAYDYVCVYLLFMLPISRLRVSHIVRLICPE